MRLILIKLKHGSPYNFVKAVHRAVFWYPGSIGMVIIKHTKDNDYLITSRGNYPKREIKNVFTEDLITEKDEVVVTIGDKKPTGAHTYTVMSSPMSFESRYGSLFPSMNGNIFVTSDIDFKEFPLTEYETSLSKYAREFILSNTVKDLMKSGDFEKVVDANPELHGGMKVVFGNKNGIYIHNAHRFLGKGGMLISDRERGEKILKFLDYKKDTPEPKETKSDPDWRPSNFRTRTYLKDIDELIYYVDNEERKKGIPFKDLEKFVVLQELSYPFLELISLKTGRIKGLIHYSLMHNHTAFRIPKLHDRK